MLLLTLDGRRTLSLGDDFGRRRLSLDMLLQRRPDGRRWNFHRDQHRGQLGVARYLHLLGEALHGAGLVVGEDHPALKAVKGDRLDGSGRRHRDVLNRTEDAVGLEIVHPVRLRLHTAIVSGEGDGLADAAWALLGGDSTVGSGLRAGCISHMARRIEGDAEPELRVA